MKLTSQFSLDTNEQLIIPASPLVNKRLVQNTGSNPAYLRFGFSSKTLRTNLTGWFDFQDNLNNSAGAGSLTAYLSPTYDVTGKVGKSVNLSTNVYLHTNGSLSLVNGNGFSIALWAKLNQLPGSALSCVVAAHQDQGKYIGIFYDIVENKFAVVVRDFAAIETVVYLNSPTISVGTWYFFELVFDPMNGIVCGSVNAGQRTQINVKEVYNNPLFVDVTLGGPIQGHFDGSLDSFATWTRPLLPGEAASLYSAGNGLGYSSLPAFSLGLYSLKLPANEILDLSWCEDAVYALADTSSPTTLTTYTDQL